MELKDITNIELVEILAERVRKLKYINDYHPIYFRDMLSDAEEIFLELKYRNSIRMEKVEKENK